MEEKITVYYAPAVAFLSKTQVLTYGGHKPASYQGYFGLSAFYLWVKRGRIGLAAREVVEMAQRNESLETEKNKGWHRVRIVIFLLLVVGGLVSGLIFGPWWLKIWLVINLLILLALIIVPHAIKGTR